MTIHAVAAAAMAARSTSSGERGKDCHGSSDGGLSSVGSTLGADGGGRATMRIIERDAREPRKPLRDAGGIGACAVGDLLGAYAAVERGWQPAYAVDKFGNTALMWAAGGGHLAAVRWLLEEMGVAVDGANKDGRTALQWACKSGQVEAVGYLLDMANADPTHRMKDDSTAFDWAVLSGHIPTMELLASHPRVDIQALNKFGCAAVQWAAAAGNVATLRWLQSQGVPLSHVNAARHGAIVKAAWKGHCEALQWLLFALDGPQLTDQLLLLDLEGRTVSQLVQLNGQHDVASWLQVHIDEQRRSMQPQSEAYA